MAPHGGLVTGRVSRRALWAVGGVVFVGVAAVAVSVSAWAGMVAALSLAAVQFAIAAKLPSQTGG